MNPAKKFTVATEVVAAVLIAAALWFGPGVYRAYQATKFMSQFSKIHDAKVPLTTAQVEDIMGRPASIEQFESVDQTISGAVYRYPENGQDFEVIFVRGVVFGTQFVHGAKS